MKQRLPSATQMNAFRYAQIYYKAYESEARIWVDSDKTTARRVHMIADAYLWHRNAAYSISHRCGRVFDRMLEVYTNRDLNLRKWHRKLRWAGPS